MLHCMYAGISTLDLGTSLLLEITQDNIKGIFLNETIWIVNYVSNWIIDNIKQLAQAKAEFQMLRARNRK